MSDKQIELKVMTSVDSFTIAETFNGTMAIHSPCGQGIIILTKEQSADFFGDSNQELIAKLQADNQLLREALHDIMWKSSSNDAVHAIAAEVLAATAKN